MTDEAKKTTPARRRKPAEPPVKAVPDVPEEQPAADPLDAIIVVRETNAEGGIDTRVILNGDVRATEVETLLKLGLQGWQRQIGV